MQNEWIINVLSDMKRFAQLNDLGRLADQLEQTRQVAAAEMGRVGTGAARDDGSKAEHLLERSGERH